MSSPSTVMIAVLLVGLGGLHVLPAAEVSFTKTIGPLLTTRCAKCHGPSRQKNDLRLDSAEAIRKGGKNGAVVVAGKPDQSPIFLRTTLPAGDKDRMPAQGELLNKEQTELIKVWIAAGAKFD